MVAGCAILYVCTVCLSKLFSISSLSVHHVVHLSSSHLFSVSCFWLYSLPALLPLVLDLLPVLTCLALWACLPFPCRPINLFLNIHLSKWCPAFWSSSCLPGTHRWQGDLHPMLCLKGILRRHRWRTEAPAAALLTFCFCYAGCVDAVSELADCINLMFLIYAVWTFSLGTNTL